MSCDSTCPQTNLLAFFENSMLSAPALVKRTTDTKTHKIKRRSWGCSWSVWTWNNSTGPSINHEPGLWAFHLIPRGIWEKEKWELPSERLGHKDDNMTPTCAFTVFILQTTLRICRSHCHSSQLHPITKTSNCRVLIAAQKEVWNLEDIQLKIHYSFSNLRQWVSQTAKSVGWKDRQGANRRALRCHLLVTT